MESDYLIGRRVLQKYEIRRLLGAGGMGRVYVAEHLEIGERYAVKVLLPEYTNRQQIVDRFVQEARLASMLRHDHIVKIVDAGQFPEDGLHYLVMEYLEGMSLEERLCQWGWETDLDAALSILLQMFSALARAHDAPEPIVHRDLKPDNVFIVPTADNPTFVKLLDFGIAKLQAESGLGLTGTGAVMGTPSYMAPEQMVNSRDVDARADIFALGVIAYRMFTGKLPFQGDSIAQIALAQHAGPPPDPRRARDELPAGWAEATTRALSIRREDRPQTVRELAQLLISGYERGALIATRVARDLQETAAPYDATTRHSATTTSYHTSGALATVGERPHHQRQPPAGPRRRAWLAGGAIAIALVAVAVTVALTRGGASPSGAAAAPDRSDAVALDPGAAAPAPIARVAPPDVGPVDVSIWIRSVPDHAELIVNGSEAGHTPLRWSGLAGSRLAIEARLDGYEVGSQAVTLQPGAPDVELSLTAKPAAKPKEQPRHRTSKQRASKHRTPTDKPAPVVDPSGVLR